MATKDRVELLTIRLYPDTGDGGDALIMRWLGTVCHVGHGGRLNGVSHVIRAVLRKHAAEVLGTNGQSALLTNGAAGAGNPAPPAPPPPRDLIEEMPVAVAPQNAATVGNEPVSEGSGTPLAVAEGNSAPRGERKVRLPRFD